MTLRLVDLPHPILLALRDGDLRTAETAIGLRIPDEFACQTDIWRFMLDRISERPENAGWTMQALVRDDEIVGNAGFKGAPDDRGVVEIGYGVLTTHRRQGLAVAACHLLLDRAARAPAVTQVLAIVDPDNVASLAVLDRAGFQPDGERVHERWGRRLRFVRPVAVAD